jgi:hypothetical protein
VIPFGVSGVPLRPVFHLGAFLDGGVPVFEISDATAEAIGLGGTVRYLSDIRR